MIRVVMCGVQPYTSQTDPAAENRDLSAGSGDSAYKKGHGQSFVSADAAIPANLAAALRAYLAAFGHEVPSDIVDKYAGRSGPLMLEIRQAVELGKPVPAWLARSKLSPLLP